MFPTIRHSGKDKTMGTIKRSEVAMTWCRGRDKQADVGSQTGPQT